MKKIYFLLFLIIIIGKTAVSQDTKSNRLIALTPSKMNVVYTDIENPITIVASGIPCNKIKATADKGTLTGENGKYILIVPFDQTAQVKEITLTVFDQSADGINKVISKQVLKVKQLPKPVVYFGGSVSGELSIEKIKSVDSLQTIIYNFYFDGFHYSIKRFNLTYVPKKGKTQTFQATSAVLTPDMKSATGNPVKGDQIMVTDIYVTYPGSSEIKLPSSLAFIVN